LSQDLEQVLNFLAKHVPSMRVAQLVEAADLSPVDFAIRLIALSDEQTLVFGDFFFALRQVVGNTLRLVVMLELGSV
jgi:hypothetical protein